MVELLHGMGFSVSYKQILRLETSLAHTVYDTALKKGTYIPRRLQKGTLVHFAVDNIDFQEDTVDGRNTFHGTITVAFQPGKTHTATSPILEVDSTKSESLPETIYSHQKVIIDRSCKSKIKIHVPQVVHPNEKQSTEQDILFLLAAGYSALKDLPRTMPVWSAMNSRLQSETIPQPLSTICPLPLFDSPAPDDA